MTTNRPNSIPPQRDRIQREALKYMRLGFSVIPIEGTNEKKPPMVWNKAKSKKQRLEWTPYQTKPADETTIRGWFGPNPEWQVAIVMGDVSGGLVCRDFDIHESYHAWAKAHPKWAETLPTIKTPVKGYHVYARMTAEAIAEFGTAKHIFDETRTIKDGEMRVSKCYCMAPPSKIPDGDYQFLLDATLGQEIPIIDIYEAGFTKYWGPAADATQSTQRTQDDTDNTREPRRTKDVRVGSSKATAIEPNQVPSMTADIQAAIAKTLPTNTGQRNRKLFDFVRELKALPETKDVSHVKELKPIVKEWHRQALPFIGTKPFDDTWRTFTHGWKKARYAAGCGKIEELFAMAKVATLPAEALEYDTPEMQLLVKLCRELQADAGEGKVFFLSCRTVAEQFKTVNDPPPHYTTTSRWLAGLVDDGLLEVIKVYPPNERKGSEYRYLGKITYPVLLSNP